MAPMGPPAQIGLTTAALPLVTKSAHTSVLDVPSVLGFRRIHATALA